MLPTYPSYEKLLLDQQDISWDIQAKNYNVVNNKKDKMHFFVINLQIYLIKLFYKQGIILKL